jgi:hypothetical protein
MDEYVEKWFLTVLFGLPFYFPQQQSNGSLLFAPPKEKRICRHYQGIHVLMETIKRGDDRVDISKAKASDLSGGYILKYDNNNVDEADTLIQLHRTGLDVVVVYPKTENILPEQKAWLSRRASYTPFKNNISCMLLFSLHEKMENTRILYASFNSHMGIRGLIALQPSPSTQLVSPSKQAVCELVSCYMGSPIMQDFVQASTTVK